MNGLYWGLYNVVERPDEAFLASYFGGTINEWQAINHAETIDNNSDRFKMLHKLAAEGHLGDPQKYAAIESYLDIPHFIDYMILNWNSGNLDWGFNNWYAGVQVPSGKIKYFVWDGERTWYDGAEIYMELDEYNNQPNLIKPLFEALLENPDFRVVLADRMYKHLFNDGALTDENSQTRWQQINNQIEQAIIAESARWGDTRHDTPVTQADWFKARDDVTAQMAGNGSHLMSLARAVGYYPALNPPIFDQHGGYITNGFKLKLIAQEAQTIYYTTDGSDPRLTVTSEIAPQAKTYSAPVELSTTTHIKARTFDGKSWSALNEAIFIYSPQN